MKIDYPIIIKNILPSKTIYSLHDNFKSDGWKLENISDNRVGKTSRKFWLSSGKNDLIIFEIATIIKLKIQKYLRKDLKFIRAHINGKTFGQSSKFHIDYPQDEIWTFVYFCSTYWETNWGGEFVCHDPLINEYKYVPYIPNTGCLIPSNWEHYGSSPNETTDKLRISIAFSFCTEIAFESVKNYRSVLPFI